MRNVGAVTSSMDCQLRILDLERGEVEHIIDAGAGETWKAVYSPDGKFVATGSQQGNVNLFHVVTRKKATSMATNGKFVLSVAYVSNMPQHV